MSVIMSELESGARPFDYNFHSNVGNHAGLYSFWLRGRCIYVGMSMDLQKRIAQHSRDEANPKLREYFEGYPKEIEISFVYLDRSEDEIRSMESQIISGVRPLANVAGVGP